MKSKLLYASPKLEQLRQLVAGARSQLAELESIRVSSVKSVAKNYES
jgi:hypothetical protein